MKSIEMKRLHVLHIVSLALLAVIFISACSNSYTLRSNEFMDLYDRNDEFRPEAYVRQFHPDSAYVYVTFRTKELLYKRKDAEQPYVARMQVNATVKALDLLERGDTTAYIFKDEQERSKDDVVTGRFSIHVEDTMKYEVKVDFIDLQSERIRSEYIFLQTYPDDLRYMDVKIEGEPKRYCACESGQELELKPYWGVDAAIWNIMELERNPAPLPFSMTLNQVNSEKKISEIKPLKGPKGWYKISCPHGNSIKLSFESSKTWVIPVFQKDFPWISGVESMTAPLRYITTNDEFDELRFSLDKQKAVSSFWLNCAPDEVRAKKLLSSYYKRVEEANLYFTDSFSEGWKSDRGLVYVAYGPPSRIIRSQGKEVWYYSVENADFGLQMHFLEGKKVKLDRSLDYRQSWYLTVDSWRNGKVSNL
jgi:GWxTD domain-containing protein